jgi:small subunit ribosomal protein S20
VFLDWIKAKFQGFMANIKSAVKRISISERNRLRNKSYTSAIKTFTKKFHQSLARYSAKPTEESWREVQSNMSRAYSKIDKAVKRRVIHRNNGARKKSKLDKALKNVLLAQEVQEALLKQSESTIIHSEGSSMIEKKFKKLSSEWKQDRRRFFLSSDIEMAENSAYQEIIKMGEAVLPMILEDLKKQLDFWFLALHEITGVNPIPTEHYGQVNKMREDWLSWGKSKGYIKD